MTMTNDKLLFEIEQQRKELIHLVQLKGMTSVETIEKSQLLDQLLNEYDAYTKDRVVYED